MPSTNGRLQAIGKPSFYDLSYTTIDLENHAFDGVVSIHLTALATTGSSITLNALDLYLVSATLKGQGNSDHDSIKQANEFRYQKQNQTVEIIFDEFTWAQGKEYILTIFFRGVLNDLMRGFYRSTYKALDGSLTTMATTQFEPTDARRAFPCLDEPALKAVFRLTVTVPRTLSCLSNTPPASIHTTGTNKTITFQPTPKMSTYLLAIVVGELDSISTISNGIATTVYTVPGKAAQGQFCLDTAVKCLDLYQKLFQVPYPLSKSDLVAVPDFAAGAMENWGLVTYREAKILVTDSTSQSTLRGIARTVCHELAHMWFGNLVTMEFWTQLWLKEGVARYMEFVAIDKIFPGWNAWTEFVQSVYGLAMSLDSMKSSHPVEVKVTHSDEINEIFDAISYAKGASLVRMISTYIGIDKFMLGMQIYLQRHAYGNAETHMLWEALQEASGVPVLELMTPWTTQTGFPILVLAETTVLTPRFLASGPGKDESEYSEQWPIPVTALVEGSDEVQGPWVIHGPAGDESRGLLEQIQVWTSEGKWFKLNVDQSGFYRVAYTDEQWNNLARAMSPSGPLSTTDRLGLISDSFAAGRSGYAPIVNSLDFVKDFGDHEEAEYAVWQELAENLCNLASLYRSEGFFAKFQNYLTTIFSSHLKRLGWDAKQGECPRTGTLRGTIIRVLSAAGDEIVCYEGFQRFCAFENQGLAIPGDLQSIIFALAMRHDEAYTFAALKLMFEASTFPEEQRNCLDVLGSVKDLSRHEEMLDYALFSGKVRLQDIGFPLNSLSSSTDEGGIACWSLFRRRYEEIKAKFASGPMWGPIVGLMCRGMRTLEEAYEVETFFEQNPPGSATRRLSQALEAIRTRAARLERDRETVTSYFA